MHEASTERRDSYRERSLVRLFIWFRCFVHSLYSTAQQNSFHTVEPKRNSRVWLITTTRSLLVHFHSLFVLTEQQNPLYIIYITKPVHSGYFFYIHCLLARLLLLFICFASLCLFVHSLVRNVHSVVRSLFLLVQVSTRFVHQKANAVSTWVPYVWHECCVYLDARIGLCVINRNSSCCCCCCCCCLFPSTSLLYTVK